MSSSLRAFHRSPCSRTRGTAIRAFSTNQVIALEHMNLAPGQDFHFTSFDSMGFKAFNSGLFTSEEHLQQNREDVRRFLRALVRGWNDNLEDPSIGARLAVEKFGSELGWISIKGAMVIGTAGYTAALCDDAPGILEPRPAALDRWRSACWPRTPRVLQRMPARGSAPHRPLQKRATGLRRKRHLAAMILASRRVTRSARFPIRAVIDENAR